MNRMLGEGSVMQLLGAMAILLHLVASGQNAGEGIPMLASGGQFRPRVAAHYGAFSAHLKRFFVFVNVATMQWSYLNGKLNSRKLLQSMTTNGRNFLTTVSGGIFDIIS